MSIIIDNELIRYTLLTVRINTCVVNISLQFVSSAMAVTYLLL